MLKDQESLDEHHVTEKRKLNMTVSKFLKLKVKILNQFLIFRMHTVL